MALASGATIGPYEITGLLGAGGMGEVYRARDTKLGREVAIKVLPPAFAQDPDRRARFEREARVLASLNHPYIAVVHGLEESSSEVAEQRSSALVMELVEGSTLAERLAQGPLALEEALPIAKQIAEALEAAHEHGIVHRDLKPGNVKLRPDGGVKVLDFGLAKALSPDPTSGNLVHSPTLSVAATRQGYVLGTAAYMAPEQARGGTIDRSADLWAFGCVLFELLTGRQVFAGEDTTDVIAAVIKSEPDWSLLPAETPQQIRTLLKQCLRKQRRQRLGDARAARFAIEEAIAEPLGAPGAAGGASAPPERRALWRPMAAGAAATAVAAALIAWALMPAPAAERAVTRLLLDIRPAERLARSLSSNRPSAAAMAISPDGRTIVFGGLRPASGDPLFRLYRRRLDEDAATPLPGTERGVAAFFSPDGRWIGFFAPRDGQLKKVPLDGGPAVVVAQIAPAGATASIRGASWGANDVIVYSLGAGGSIFRVSANGGTPERMTELDEGQSEQWHGHPQLLPGGRTMLYTALISTSDAPRTDVFAQRLDTGERRRVLEDAADARFVSSGHLLYLRGGTLMAAPFDADRITLTGPSVAVLDDVMQAVGANNSIDETYSGQFQVSASGTLVYISGGPFPRLTTELFWMDRDGTEELAYTGVEAYGPRISPDGTRIATFMRTGQSFSEWDIWIYDLGRSSATRLTFGGSNAWPLWSPTGRDLLFTRTVDDKLHLIRVPADGSGAATRVTATESDGLAGAWSQTDVVALLHEGPRSQIWTLPMGAREAEAGLFLESPFTLLYPEFSPDGRWLAYTSSESGASEVYVQPYPGPGARVRISTDGGTGPVWSRDGRELFFTYAVGPDRMQMLVVDVDTADGLRASRPNPLFEGELGQTTPFRSYDVAPDGRRFIVARVAADSMPPPVTQMHVVLNWTEELARRVPVN